VKSPKISFKIPKVKIYGIDVIKNFLFFAFFIILSLLILAFLISPAINNFKKAKKTYYQTKYSLDITTKEYKEKMLELKKLKNVNKKIYKIKYQTDKRHWHKKDYWATPLEFLGKDKGDCEDYVISKYFALKYLGVEPKKLFFTYVRSTKFKQPHMVLTYFETPRSEPLILDNNNHRIFPASKRKDLTPIYNFNGEVLQKGKKKKSHKKWDQLKLNMKRNKI